MDDRKYYLKLLKQELNDDTILEKIRNLKYNLLSEEEKRLINIYLNDKRLINYKKAFINSFINRLKKVNNDTFIYYYKNLSKICSLNINFKFSVNTSKIESYSNDLYFTSLIENNDYENLHKYYDIETIEKNSNIRGKK